MSGFAGFDASGFPGLATTSWLKTNTNLRWCGFYLGPAPSHLGGDWMLHRAALVQQGWGIAPLYVGQQVVGKGRKLSSGPQGRADGLQAVSLMKSAGFAAGTFVYLDLENGPPLASVQRDYVGSWVDTVAANGFGPGIYCSHGFALEVHALRPAARIWAFKIITAAIHLVPGSNFPDSHPSGSGFTGSFIWQIAQNAVIDVKSPQTLKVDLDTAVTPDPGR
ncbi:glycoside hydrolase domain-containing protein [Mesorhizobium sp. URHB0026]